MKYYKFLDNGALQICAEKFESSTALDISVEDAKFLRFVNGILKIDEDIKSNYEKAIMENKACAIEIKDLENWFENYDRKVSEHNRCLRLNIPCTHDIVALDNEAVIKEARLKELKTKS